METLLQYMEGYVMVEKQKFELNKIHPMDALKGIENLSDNTCQIIIADPPYNIGKDFGNNHDKKELSEYLDWCDKWITECIRVLKPDGTMFIYGFSEILAHLFVRIPIHKRWLVWHYTNKNMPTVKFWQRSHESIICCWKSKYAFNLDDVREPYTEGFLNGSAGKIRPPTPGRLSKKGKEVETIYNAHPKGALPRDVIKIPTLAGGSGVNERVNHPTQKPLALCDKLILSAKQKDGIVLVPFAGSGSECVSAKKFGLDFIGFEINPKYIEIAEERLKNTYSKILSNSEPISS